MINLTSSIVRGLQTGYDTKLKNTLTAQLARKDLLSARLLDDTTASGMESMTYEGSAGIPILEEIIGDRQVTKNASLRTPVTVFNKRFSRPIKMRREVLERNGASIYMRDITNAAVGFSMWKERRLAMRLKASLTNGFFVKTGGTAKKLAAEKGATYFNATDKKFSEANFEAAVQNLQEREDAEGNNLGLGSNLLLVVSPKYYATARKVLKTQQLNNSTNIHFEESDLMSWGQLSSASIGLADAWFLFDLSMKPGVLQVEVPFQSGMITNPMDSYVIENHAFLYYLYFGGDIDLIDPLACYGSDGSQAA